jgi:phage tail sheath gpL-like
MSAEIVVTGLAANDPVPGVYQEINFAQGNSSGFEGERVALIIGNKTTAGSATTNTVLYGPDTVVPMQTEPDVISVFGAGSPVHRMFRRFVKVNQVTKLYAICVPESAGAQATGTITLTNTATAGGSLRIYVGDEFVDTAIATGDTPTVIATAAVLNVNAQTHWPVTASNASGVITLTHKTRGPRGNWTRFQAIVMTAAGATIATASSAATDAFMTGGTTADSNATALTTIFSHYFYYIISEAEDATQVGALLSQVNNQAQALTGTRQRVFSGSVDTLASTTTLATGFNGARAELEWHKAAPWVPGEIAANNAAIYALFENTGTKPRNNYSGFGKDEKTKAFWFVPPSRDATAAPTRLDVKSALNNGITPIGVNTNGSTYLVKRVTTRSLNGSTVDYRIRDAHKVTIMDFLADAAQSKLANQFSGKDLADDPPKGARPPGPDTLTPLILRGALLRLVDDFDENGMLQHVEDTKMALQIVRSTAQPTRITARLKAWPVDICDQIVMALDQVG